MDEESIAFLTKAMTSSPLMLRPRLNIAEKATARITPQAECLLRRWAIQKKTGEQMNEMRRHDAE